MTTYQYRDLEGRLLFVIHRVDFFNRKTGKPDKRPLPVCYCRHETTGETQWIWKRPSPPLPLFGLDDLGQRVGVPVLIVEGEKAVLAARTLAVDYVSITSPGGCKAAMLADWSPLAGRCVAAM